MGIVKKEKFWGDLGNFDPNLRICPGFEVKKWLNFESVCG